ncbi:MAG: UDP-N-acetylglucosamine--N-acetylmuramyl-(pentapeptide) pyrophosphoryl-undecaprenol N-acetylglucosamine transferase [Ilumatobacter sp.]|nr:UDP-N-acetylglucosamine--N-acetylmuramyl-(pentapeptide) pyrophosphoryl-undecaprenol N-acetylglucosamine transferase [Ilumatobacter sp.]
MSEPTSESAVYAVVTGGGTSGHVLPALAVAEGLVARGHDPSTIHYAGCRRGIETRLLPDTPFPHHFYDVDGFQRSLSKRNLSFVPKMWRARREAIERFRVARPQVVVSVGGYASMPSVFAARKLDIPVVVVSYDLKPGRASQVAAKRAAACAVAFPDSPLPRATLTGAPVRQSILDVDRSADRAAARAELGVPDDRFVVAIMGGSQGSGVLNDAVWSWLERVADDRGLAVRHAVGERFLDRAPAATGGDDGVLYQPIGYEPRMPLVYAAADVLVGRGGASTVHEVAVTGTPAVLVPWAASADDHQTLNVRWLADDGAAVMLPESDVERLGDVLDELRSDPARRNDLARRAAEVGEVHRSGALARLVESVAEGTS